MPKEMAKEVSKEMTKEMVRVKSKEMIRTMASQTDQQRVASNPVSQQHCLTRSECDIRENFDTNECPNIFVSTKLHE